MIKYKLPLLVALVLLDACADHITAPSPLDSLAVSVLTQHNDYTRSGWNANETVLNTSNVNVQSFGAVFTLPVDDQVYAQPLVVANVPISNGYHNVVYVATVNNTLYAFDGDDGRLYWRKNFTHPGMRVPKNTDMYDACGGQYTNFSGSNGMGGTYAQELHAVNIVSGSDLAGSPEIINASVAGNGDGSVNNVVGFDSQRANQRQALTLVNGVVYVSFSSHCDWGPYHGWILGYDA